MNLTKKSKWATALALVTAMSLAATPASAATVKLTDAQGDVVTNYGGFANVGYFDGDITAATISYTSKTLKVTTKFSELEDITWNLAAVEIDTNNNGKADYSILADGPASWDNQFLFRQRDEAYVADASVTQRNGKSGTTTLSIPSKYLKNPKSLRVRIIFGYVSSTTGEIFNADAIPNDRSGQMLWSPAVKVTQVATIIKPSVKLSKKTQTVGKAPAKLTVKVSPKTAKGKVAIYDGKKKLKTVTLKNGTAKYTFSKKLKPGKHKITAKYFSSDKKRFLNGTSSKTTLTVKKK